MEVELSSSFEYKNTPSCGRCSLSSQELGGSHQAPWILTHVLGTRPDCLHRSCESAFVVLGLQRGNKLEVTEPEVGGPRLGPVF